MPWLVLILLVAWLLGKSNLLCSHHREPRPTQPAPEAAREAASAWSSYVPAEDEPDAVPEPPSPTTPTTPLSPVDDAVWEKAQLAEAGREDEAVETRDPGVTDDATEDPDVLRQADGQPRDPYDDVPDRSNGEVVDSEARPSRAFPDDEGTPQPGGGAITDPADEPRPPAHGAEPGRSTL